MPRRSMPHACNACQIYLMPKICIRRPMSYSPGRVSWDRSHAFLLRSLRQCRSEIGAFAAPDVIHWAPALPKTRSGKIMRRILRKIAANGKEVSADDLGDTSTLAEPAVVDQLISSFGE
eukprot:6185156-Pleurochrysis_carterae.AAC.1